MTAKKASSTVGTPHTLAPEVIQGDYDYRCDIWSLGIMMYELILGRSPFEKSADKSLFKVIETGVYDTNFLGYKSISEECRDLIDRFI